MSRFASNAVGPPAELPLRFEVDGDVFTLPALPTRTLLERLVCDPPACWWNLVPREVDHGDRLHRRLTDPDDDFDLDQLESVAEAVLSTLLGTGFHAGQRLLASAYANWMAFDGWCWTRGQDPLAQPIGRVAAAVYAWRRSLCAKDADLVKLDQEIWAPPPGLTVTGQPRDAAPDGWDDDTEADLFAAAMAGLGRG